MKLGYLLASLLGMSLLVACNSGGTYNNEKLSLTITPQTCSLAGNSSMATGVSGMTANDTYYFGSSNTESGTYVSFTSPQTATGSNIIVTSSINCQDVESQPGLYYIRALDTTQNIMSNPVQIQVMP